jgi:asparagine synthase (glutamine-hydrolysing)
MCGVAGYLTAAPRPAEPGRLEAMLEPIRRRGPDDEGLCLVSRRERVVRHLHTDRSVAAWRGATPHLGEARGELHDLALLHARYAVIDLTDEAHQPFSLAGGDIVVAFQGEIFNYVELRHELEARGGRFHTASDTEVLARAYHTWGDEAWERLNGLWAAALYDVRAGRLVLCRDRLGIAPLHLAESAEGVFFGSSALGVARACFGSARPAIDQVSDFLETGLRNVDERTLLDGVRSLPPGTFLSLPLAAGALADASLVRYWDLPGHRLGVDDLSIDEASARLRDLLSSAVEYRLRADLDIAFQLSGGLDSTTIVALAAALRDEPLSTYTVSVPEEDEEPLARTMEKRFRLSRRTLDSGEAAFGRVAAGFARLMEEPLQAPGAYGHHHMCRVMAGDGFGVTLSGSGGDEVLAGYEWDFWPAARRLLWREGRALQAEVYHAVLRFGSPARALGTLGDWARRAGSFADRRPPVDGSDDLSRPDDPSHAGELQRTYPTLPFDARCRFHLRVADLPYYLASNDRATLGIPLEHRQPFLDHRVVELGLRMPVAYLFRRGWTKYVLRRAMEPLLPPEILWRRKKTGFPFPAARLLERSRAELEPAVRRTDEGGFSPEPATDYEGLLRSDPLRLWRKCSVGLWLDVLDAAPTREGLEVH